MPESRRGGFSSAFNAGRLRADLLSIFVQRRTCFSVATRLIAEVRCRYTFRIDSSMKLDPPIRFSFQGRRFHFDADETGRLVALRVEVDNCPRESWPTFRKHGEEMPTLKIPLDPNLIAISLDVQAARGALALWCIHDIDTDYPKIEWMPENEQEKHDLDVPSFNFQRGSPKSQLVSAPLDMLVRCVLSAEQFETYAIPLDFYRRCFEDMQNERYIEAIYDLWFILEYLFGGGVHSKAGIERAFQQDRQLLQSLDALRVNWEGPPATHEQDWSAIKAKYLSRPNQEIIKDLVAMRGFLHHQSLKRKLNWNPMRQRGYRADAVFLRWLCQDVLMKVSCDIIFEPSAVDQFKSMEVTDPLGRKINWTPHPGLS